MTKLRVGSFSLSAAGDAAGPGQDMENPLGQGGMRLHDGAFATLTFRQTHGGEGGEGGDTGIDDDFARRGLQNIGAWILGRNMFGPQRGP